MAGMKKPNPKRTAILLGILDIIILIVGIFLFRNAGEVYLEYVSTRPGAKFSLTACGIIASIFGFLGLTQQFDFKEKIHIYLIGVSWIIVFVFTKLPIIIVSLIMMVIIIVASYIDYKKHNHKKIVKKKVYDPPAYEVKK